MLPDGNQRWSQQKSTYRPPTEVIKTADYEVAVLTTDKAAKTFIQEHHYSGTYPASRFRFGLFTHGNLVGVAVFSVPMQNKVISNVFPEHNVNDYTELGRFVLLDEVPGNGETEVLPTRSQECCPCVNANREDQRQVPEVVISIEAELGISSTGKPKTMFRPKSKMGAVGIVEVIRWAKAERGKYLPIAEEPDVGNGSGCDSGFCGG